MVHSMSESFCKIIENNLPALSPLLISINHFLSGQSLPQETIFRVNLAIEEIVTNIVKYGYDDRNGHAIKVVLDLRPAMIHLRIEDDGHSFDPLQAPEPDIHVPLDQRKIGGLGLHLVRKLVDGIAYRREKDLNILEIDISRQG